MHLPVSIYSVLVVLATASVLMFLRARRRTSRLRWVLALVVNGPALVIVVYTPLAPYIWPGPGRGPQGGASWLVAAVVLLALPAAAVAAPFQLLVPWWVARGRHLTDAQTHRDQ